MSLSLVPQRALDVREYRSWSQQDWQNFVQSGEAARLDRNALETDSFQKLLFEVGVLGGTEFFKRLPMIFLRDGSYDEHIKRHTVLRVVFHSGQTDLLKEFVRFQFNGNLFVLAKHAVSPGYSFWEIVRPSIPNDRRLVSNPAVYTKIREIASIDRVANATLLSFLPQAVASLALEYADFPQKPRERFDEMQEVLFKHFRLIDDRQFDFDQEHHNDAVGKIENIEKTIGGYVDVEDRVEDTDVKGGN